MRWESNPGGEIVWSQPISNLEAKREVGARIAREVKDGDVIGFGSGSTCFVAIHEIAAVLKQRGISCTAIPTSLEVALTCAQLNIRTASLIEARPDWGFDGADEIDPEHNLIKGRGGAMYREKLVIDSSPRMFILADPSKLVAKLGTKFPVPVEVDPQASHLVTRKLSDLGATKIDFRRATGKDGPVITENGNLIVDATFPEIAPDLERRIKSITGVFESGLFLGRRPEIMLAAAPPEASPAPARP